MCDKCGYEKCIRKLKRMLKQDKYKFSYSFLNNVLNWITTNKHVTQNQISAIEKILRVQKLYEQGLAPTSDRKKQEIAEDMQEMAI